jgi:hypothetical protein
LTRRENGMRYKRTAASAFAIVVMGFTGGVALAGEV